MMGRSRIWQHLGGYLAPGTFVPRLCFCRVYSATNACNFQVVVVVVVVVVVGPWLPTTSHGPSSFASNTPFSQSHLAPPNLSPLEGTLTCSSLS
jgi:hypothetical protein